MVSLLFIATACAPAGVEGLEGVFCAEDDRCVVLSNETDGNKYAYIGNMRDDAIYTLTNRYIARPLDSETLQWDFGFVYICWRKTDEHFLQGACDQEGRFEEGTTMESYYNSGQVSDPIEKEPYLLWPLD